MIKLKTTTSILLVCYENQILKVGYITSLMSLFRDAKACLELKKCFTLSPSVSK